jgi:CcmD family protein
VSNTAWLFVALAAVFLMVGGYSIALVMRQRKLSERLEELQGPTH